MSFIQLCTDKARSIPYTKGRARVYSLIVSKRGKILSESQNLYEKSHTLQKHYSVKAGFDPERCYLHSELASIIKAAKMNPKDCTLYVARVGSKGQKMDAWPCPSCRLAIAETAFITSVQVTIGE